MKVVLKPKKISGYQGMIHLRPFIAVEHLLLGEFRGRIRKFGIKSEKLSESSENLNLVKLRFRLDLMYKMAITCSILKIQDSYFTHKPKFVIICFS